MSSSLPPHPVITAMTDSKGGSAQLLSVRYRVDADTLCAHCAAMIL